MRKISRRSFIKAATFTAAAAALTACGGSSSSTTTASSTAASAADNTPSNKGTGVTLTVYTNSETDGRDEWLIERAAQDGFRLIGLADGNSFDGNDPQQPYLCFPGGFRTGGSRCFRAVVHADLIPACRHRNTGGFRNGQRVWRELPGGETGCTQYSDTNGCR